VLDDLFAGLWALLLTWGAVVAKGRLLAP